MRPLVIYTRDVIPIDVIKAAKAALDLPFRVYVSEMAEPELDVRVLAIGSRPPFLCDYALVTAKTNQAGFERALAWVLGTGADPRANTIISTLQSIMPGAREIPPEELESEKRYQDYVLGRD